jgi:MFS family permease
MGERYWGELRVHAKPLFAATLGIAFGMMVNTYTSSLFGAHLIKEFGWERSDFALIGIFSFILFLLLPITGRITDLFGVRVAAGVGIFLTPLSYFALSQMNGDIRVFFAINFVQMLIMSFTTSTVYNRVVADRFINARGIAFAIVMMGAPVAGAIIAPWLGDFIDLNGWRAGYLAMGAICFFFGIIALFLLPPVGPRTPRPSHLRADFALVSHSKPFWLLAGGMWLVNLPQALGASQLMIMLAEQGISLKAAGFLSVYPAGVILGRLVFGGALDRLPPHIVGGIGLALPALGFAILASSYDSSWAIAFSVLLMGLAQGAEGDVAAFLVGRHFPLGIFASVNGLIGGFTALGASLGSLLLVGMLKHTDTFTAFLLFSVIVTLIGSVLIAFVGPGKKEVFTHD